MPSLYLMLHLFDESPSVNPYHFSECLAAARREAWEDRDPGGIRVLLSNPRWEKRLLRFLELSGIERVVADGTDEGDARARRMDGWM